MSFLTSLHPYPAYRPSGVPWRGDVPIHWQVSAVKQGYQIQLGKMLRPDRETPNDRKVPYLKAIHVQWLSVQTVDPPTMWANPREIVQFGIEKGDLLVCEGGEGGRSGMVRSDVGGYIIQNALHRIRPMGLNLNEYLQFVMYTAAAYRWFDALNAKATIAHFTREKLSAFQIPLPPPPEQRAIVRYLDYVDRRIRRYISTKQKLIALLEEEKQAIINQAVTRGLDPNVRLKPSGVGWLGDVPEHWEVRRLKTICSMKSGEGITADTIEESGDFPVYGGNGLRGFTSSYTHDGEFALIGRQGALCGNVHIARDKFWATEHAVVAKLGAGHHIEWFGAILTTMNLNQYSIAAAQPGLAVDRVLNLHLPVPPEGEQRQIASYIDDATINIASTITQTRRQIELLQEYRTRLIADAVTGKLDVREAAAQLPEEPDDQALEGTIDTEDVAHFVAPA